MKEVLQVPKVVSANMFHVLVDAAFVPVTQYRIEDGRSVRAFCNGGDGASPDVGDDIFWTDSHINWSGSPIARADVVLDASHEDILNAE